MDIQIFSLFPDMLNGPLNMSILGKAQEKGLISINVVNFRDFAMDKHKHVDDNPFGGGAGMVIKPQPLVDALRWHGALADDIHKEVILLSPQGKTFHQTDALRLVQKTKLVFICGHYEGFDERIRYFVNSEYSIGDFVLTGGELPAMVMIDAIARLIPGVIKEQVSFEEDSFFNGLLEYPQYTRPRVFEGLSVPEVLLSGHHANICQWQKKESLRRTYLRRPDLLDKLVLSEEDQMLLKNIIEDESS